MCVTPAAQMFKGNFLCGQVVVFFKCLFPVGTETQHLPMKHTRHVSTSMSLQHRDAKIKTLDWIGLAKTNTRADTHLNHVC